LNRFVESQRLDETKSQPFWRNSPTFWFATFYSRVWSTVPEWRSMRRSQPVLLSPRFRGRLLRDGRERVRADGQQNDGPSVPLEFRMP
jgi:hypothetical protein